MTLSQPTPPPSTSDSSYTPAVVNNVRQGQTTKEERMDSIGKRQCADLAWPTTEELFREPPTQECDICSLPMSNAVKPWLEGSLAMFSVSRFMLAQSCARSLLFGCSRNVFISLAAESASASAVTIRTRRCTGTVAVHFVAINTGMLQASRKKWSGEQKRRKIRTPYCSVSV